ncbi:MAG: lipocalin family protein [Melioribacteraceae bacterium]
MFNLIQLREIVIICSIFTFFFFCNDNKSTEPEETNLVGHWKISKMSWYGPESGNFNQRELDSLGLVWDIILNLDNSAEQITNLSGPITNQTGTWSKDNNKLTMNLKAPTSDEVGTMVYTCAIENNILKLNWALPLGSINYVAEFIKQ